MKTTIRLVLTVLTFVCLAAVGPKAQAVVPAPDGGYPNFTTAEGQNALFSLTTGAANTAVGWYSLFSNTDGSFNTAAGAGSLLFNTADNNTGFGAAALLFNTIGGGNTAVGTAALLNNTEGGANTAIGVQALNANTTGTANTAIGGQALVSNTEGEQNTATGSQALALNTTGAFNTANGVFALFSNTTGTLNMANGVQALQNNTEGDANTAIGYQALISNTTGSGNTVIGSSALSSNISGDNNTVLGFAAGGNITTANQVICIGANGANVNFSCFIGHIRGVQTANADAVPVLIDSAGQLGTVSSSRRFKHEIRAMDNASEAIHALKPVTFHYKSDKTGTPQFGLIAEEVAAMNPDLVVRDENGEIYTVRYDAVNAMLLNEFLKEHRKVEELTKDFQATIAQLTARLDEQAAQIQKVSAQLEASKPASQVVNNP